MTQPSTRVAAGTLRGRKLSYPAGRLLRPTMQRTKEAVFSAIEARMAGAGFVDLYAAAGGIGIEALSRGASFVHFVERHPVALEHLQRNLDACAVDPKRFRVHAGDVEHFLDGAVLRGPAVRVVFADPPYDSDEAASVLAHFDANAYSPLELLIVEHREPLPAPAGALRLSKQKRYGDARVSYFEPANGG